MRHSVRLDRPNLLELQFGADVVEEPSAATKHQRDDVQLDLVDEPRREVLVDEAGAAADQDVLSGRGATRLIEADSIPSLTNVNVVSERVSGSRS